MLNKARLQDEFKPNKSMVQVTLNMVSSTRKQNDGCQNEEKVTTKWFFNCFPSAFPIIDSVDNEIIGIYQIVSSNELNMSRREFYFLFLHCFFFWFEFEIYLVFELLFWVELCELKFFFSLNSFLHKNCSTISPIHTLSLQNNIFKTLPLFDQIYNTSLIS